MNAFLAIATDTSSGFPTLDAECLIPARQYRICTLPNVELSGARDAGRPRNSHVKRTG